MHLIKRIRKSVIRYGLFGVFKIKIVDILLRMGKGLRWVRDYQTKYTYVDRSTGSQTLIVILAGYKAYLWPATLTRITALAPKDADICVACSGTDVPKLQDICSKNGWSYLSTIRNSPGVAVNRAICLHKNATHIFKIDEDIFISKDLFKTLIDGYKHIYLTSGVEPGFCSPILTVNGISYSLFLDRLSLTDAYKAEFGNIVTRCDRLPIHSDPTAAYWIWTHSLPLDKIANGFLDNELNYHICNTRFSIGAILITRDFWRAIGGFSSSWYPGILGVDEDNLCRECVSRSRPMCVVENALAGHFSFYPQEAFMRKMLPELSKADPVTFPAQYYGSPSTIN